MISSPCRNCENKDMPKDECLETCRKLDEIHRLQFSRREISICQAVDYADDNRFLIGHAEYRPSA